MKWEYKVIAINSIKNLGKGEDLQNELNNYGEQGWSLENPFDKALNEFKRINDIIGEKIKNLLERIKLYYINIMKHYKFCLSLDR